MDIWRALRGNTEECSYLSSSPSWEGQIRPSCLSLNPGGPGTSVCVLKELRETVRWDISRAAADFLPPHFWKTAPLNEMWLQIKVITWHIYERILESCHQHIFSIYSSFFLSLLLQRPYVRPIWSLFTFQDTNYTTVPVGLNIVNVWCKLFFLVSKSVSGKFSTWRHQMQSTSALKVPNVYYHEKSHLWINVSVIRDLAFQLALTWVPQCRKVKVLRDKTLFLMFSEIHR